MEHPLSDMMTNTMSKIKDMVDVNTVVGSPITTPGGVTIIPVTKVSIGYGGGGSDFAMKNMPANRDNPFGGGAGAGIKITPVAFLVIRGENVRMLPVAEPASTSVDRLIELLPDLLEKGEAYFAEKKAAKEAEKAAEDTNFHFSQTHRRLNPPLRRLGNGYASVCLSESHRLRLLCLLRLHRPELRHHPIPRL